MTTQVATNGLRFVRRAATSATEPVERYVLQQWWEDPQGVGEWRDVPLEDEAEDGGRRPARCGT